MSIHDNHLLDLLGRVERKRLLERCEPTDWAMSEVVCERHSRTQHVYFPTAGFVSLEIETADRPGLEVGMVGREGMLGAELLLGQTAAPWRAVVQDAGSAWRMKPSGFQAALVESPALRRLVSRYLSFRMEQLSLGAACERFHEIGPRLARWLLMSQDRARANTFYVTHAFLACILGVRRVGVTVAAGEMQRLGLIEYRRGRLTVLDRDALHAKACSCYDSNRRCYEQTVG